MKLTLPGGREIKLVQLDQLLTYYVHLLGTPNAQINAIHVQDALERARKLCGLGVEPVLVPPRAGDWLPKVTSIAMFDSGALTKPGSDSFSSAVVLWYQDEFGIPTDPAVLNVFGTLDWEAVAVDWDP